MLTDDAILPLKLHLTLLNQLANTSVQPDLDCPSPATRCDFDKLSTLGLCRNYSNVTDSTSRSCTRYPYPAGTFDHIIGEHPSDYINCTYTVKGVDTFRNLTINFGGPDGFVYDSFRSILDVIDSETSLRGVFNESYDIARMFTIRVDDIKNDAFFYDGDLDIPSAQVAMTNWYWCEQTYTDVSMNRLDGKMSGLTDPTTTPLLVWVIESGGMEGLTFTTPASTSEYYSDFLEVQFMNQLFLIDAIHTKTLDPSLEGTRTHYTYTGGYANDPNNTEDYVVDTFGMANFMSNVDMSELTQNIAMAITNSVLQAGDNQNFTTTKGTTFVRTPYYHVRWAWLILPLLEALATAVLLVLTMWLNSLPLLKSSNIALLAHGPEDAVNYRVDGAETTGKWDDFGKGLQVILMEDEKGWSRLIRT